MQIDQKGLEDLQMARLLIQEAKGFEGELGGPITDHLDAAEGWLDRVEAAILAYLAASEKERAEPVGWGKRP